MRICYINPTNNIRRPVVELARLMAEKGHKITVVFPSSPKCKTEGFHYIKLLEHENITVVPVKSYYYANLRYSFPKPFELFRKIKKAIKENDIIHIWEYYYPISVPPLLLKPFYRKKKFILTSDGFVGYSYKPKEPWWLVPAFKLYTQLFARFLFRLADVFTTYGKSMIPYAKKAGVPMKKLKILSTGINLAKFESVEKGLVRKEFNVGKSFLILFVGMLTERKNVDIVVSVSARLLDEGYDVKTLIVGEGPLEGEFKAMVPEKYSNKIIFTGGRKDVANFYYDVDMLFLPSMGEGLPGVVMEAMACGLPCIATNEGCTPDLITDGKEGFLVEPYDEKGYYDAVLKVMKDKNNKLSINSRAKIKKLSWVDVSKNYEGLYTELKK